MPDLDTYIYIPYLRHNVVNQVNPWRDYKKEVSLFVDIADTKNRCFGIYSNSLMYKTPHKTQFLDIAQSYVGKIVEVTGDELKFLTPLQKRNTQVEIIGDESKYNFQWCAYTTNYMCKKTGIDIGPAKKSVQEFIDWGKSNGFYNSIKTNTMSVLNYIQERANRAAQIKNQTKNMREGDLIIWKSDVMYNTQIGLKGCNASHIGIIERVNPDGSVVVIEGNANEVRKDKKYERYVVTNAKEAENGNQEIGEFQEINRRDGIIRKIYTVEELATNGYSGYINMQKIVK